MAPATCGKSSARNRPAQNEPGKPMVVNIAQSNPAQAPGRGTFPISITVYEFPVQ